MKKQNAKFSKNAILYLTAIIFFYISSGAFSMLQGIYIKELSIGEGFLGLIISLRTLALAGFSIPCAIFVNKFGKKKGIILAMLLIPFLIILQGYFQNRWLILILAILHGGINAFISGAIGLVSCIFVAMIKENQESASQISNAFYRDMIKVVRQRNSLNFLIYNFIIGFGAGLVVPYFNVYLKYKVNIGTEQIGVIMSLAQGAMGIGGLITPLLAARFGKINTIIMCQIASIPFLMLIAMPPSILIVSVAMFMRNGLMNMAGPIVGNMSMEMVNGNERSIFASVNNIAGNLSRGLSAVVAGFIMNNLANGYEIPYFITAVLYLIATIFFYRSFKNYKFKKVSAAR